MSTPSAVSPGESAPAVGGWLVNNHYARMFHTLVRREFWEHRALWMAPLVVSALLLLCALLTHGALQIDSSDSAEWLDPQVKSIVFALALWGLTVPFYLVILLVLSLYLLDCLYGERRDRSILFWKSLPVGDGMTVAAKVFTGCIVVPLGTFVLALVTDLLFTVIWDLRGLLGHTPELVVWDTAVFFKTQALMFFGLIISILWYAPFFGCLVLASAWVRRNVLMWVTLIPLLAIIAERIAFGTHYFYNLLGYRSGGIWMSLHLEGAFLKALTGVGQAVVVSIPSVYDSVHIAPAFANIDLWLGLAFAGACFFAAARIRRYRDDT